MSNQHEHKWGIASRNGYEAKFRCKFWDCAETLTPEQIETMLNEHAALEAKNAELKEAVQAAIDYFTDGITSKEQYDAYLRFVDAAQPFFGGE